MKGRSKHTQQSGGDLVVPVRVRVRSAVPGADFEAMLSPVWEAVDRVVIDDRWTRQATLVAAQHLSSVTEDQAQLGLVHHSAAIELAINRILAFPTTITKPIAITITGSVELVAAPGSTALTDDYLGVLRDDQSRNERAQKRLACYRDIFANKERAWLWWADQRPEKLHELSYSAFETMLDKIHKARAARDPEDDQPGDSFARLLGDIIEKTKPEQTEFAIGIMRSYIEYLHPEFADRLNRLENQTQHDRGHHEGQLQAPGHGNDASNRQPDRRDNDDPEGTTQSGDHGAPSSRR